MFLLEDCSEFLIQNMIDQLIQNFSFYAEADILCLFFLYAFSIFLHVEYMLRLDKETYLPLLFKSTLSERLSSIL